MTAGEPIYILGGARTPFCKAGTALASDPVQSLAAAAMQEALARANVNVREISEVILGNVGTPSDAANPARVAALLAGLPESVPALTVSRNCASGMESVADAAARLRAGMADMVVACGAESMSNYPFLFKESARRKFMSLLTARGNGAKWSAMTAFRVADFRPRVALEEGLRDPVAGVNMGQTAERLAHEWNVTRAEQDAFALQSHRRAAAAATLHKEEMLPYFSPVSGELIHGDVGPRPQQSMEALTKLRPFFDRKFGSVTAGNASQITDGASAVVLCREDGVHRRRALGRLLAVRTVALDPSRMGLGPAHAIPLLLQESKLRIEDVALFEINEAFAAQVLACQRAMADGPFCAALGLPEALGAIPEDKLNVNGGAIALGHPVGASANRLILTCLMELRRRKGLFGVVSVCVGGGQGSAMLVEALYD